MRSRPTLIKATIAVLAAVVYFALVPAHWYERHLPFWVRLPVGVILGALWLLLFVGVPLWARFSRGTRQF